MKKLKMTMEFLVEDSKVDLFSKELRKKMHKFLSAHSTEVNALDVEVNTIDKPTKGKKR